MQIIKEIRYNNVYKMLLYKRDFDFWNQISCIADSTKLFKTIQNITLNNYKLKSHKAIIDIKNILILNLSKKNQFI